MQLNFQIEVNAEDFEKETAALKKTHETEVSRLVLAT